MSAADRQTAAATVITRFLVTSREHSVRGDHLDQLGAMIAEQLDDAGLLYLPGEVR